MQRLVDDSIASRTSSNVSVQKNQGATILDCEHSLEDHNDANDDGKSHMIIEPEKDSQTPAVQESFFGIANKSMDLSQCSKEHHDEAAVIRTCDMM